MTHTDRLSTNECSRMRMLKEKCWAMLDEKFVNCLCPTVLDDVVPKCCIRLNGPLQHFLNTKRSFF